MKIAEIINIIFFLIFEKILYTIYSKTLKIFRKNLKNKKKIF